jgi:hypothetical protein
MLSEMCSGRPAPRLLKEERGKAEEAAKREDGEGR